MSKKIKLFRQLSLNLILIIVLSLVQLSFIGELPGIFGDLNLIIVALLFVLVLTSLKHSVIWAITTGFFLDVLSFQSFGLYLVTLTLTTLALYFLLNSFLTNRSLYSMLVLTIFATLINEFFWLVSVNFLKIIGIENSIHFFNLIFLSNLIGQLFLNVLASAIIFQSVNFISHKLSPVFLIRSKKL